MELLGSDAMRSRLVGALAAITLVAAMSLNTGIAWGDTMPIHRGLPNDGYGEPDVGNGLPRQPFIVFSIQLPGTSVITFKYHVSLSMSPRGTSRSIPSKSSSFRQLRHAP
jgi:hypothetical protein